MKEGTVKFYNPARGFGFIKGEDGPDIFIELAEVAKMGIRTIMEGQKVSYQIQSSDDKTSAINLKLIK